MTDLSFLVTVKIAEGIPSWANETTRGVFMSNARFEIDSLLSRTWKLVDFTVEQMPLAAGGEATLNVTTGDPCFDPNKPVTVNGFLFLPAPVRAVATAAEEAMQIPPTRAPQAKIKCAAVQQNDEMYCPSCGLRWPAGEEKPPCPRER